MVENGELNLLRAQPSVSLFKGQPLIRQRMVCWLEDLLAGVPASGCKRVWWWGGGREAEDGVHMSASSASSPIIDNLANHTMTTLTSSPQPLIVTF